MLFILQNFEALLLILCGGYCTYLGFRGVPAGTAKPAEWQQWYEKWGRLLKYAGPIIILMGAVKFAA
jgi:hypothetical protein